MKSAFHTHFSGPPEVVVRSPGRINLIGEHTDYNEGWVFPAAIDKAMTVEIGSGFMNVEVVATDFGERFFIDYFGGRTPPKPAWGKYVEGMIRGMGLWYTSMEIAFGGDIPIGAGMSSSAALCVGLGLAFNELFGLGLTREQIAKIAQETEREAGVNCGLMDQYASLFGRAGHFLKLDCRDLTFEYVPADLGDYALLLCDSRVKHSLADSAYNRRREECAEGLHAIQHLFPECESLRDATLDMLKSVESFVPDAVADRARYVIKENLRVAAVAEALPRGAFETVGQCLYATHDGLRDEYEVSCSELDFLVDLTRPMPEVAGARLMGGGFGGCTLNLIRKAAIPQFQEKIAAQYFLKFGIEPPFYAVQISDGGQVIRP
jgi:galactokinase